MKSSLSMRNTVTSLLISSLLLQQQDVVAAAVGNNNNNNKGDQWVSLSPRTSFLPATGKNTNTNNSEQHLRRLKNSNNNNGYANVLADGMYGKYDSYAQAWRLLGLYVDCESQVEDQGRRLEGDDEEEQEENQEEEGGEENEEEGEEEGNEEEGDEADEGDDANANEYNMNRQCTRYMLWAAVRSYLEYCKIALFCTRNI